MSILAIDAGLFLDLSTGCATPRHLLPVRRLATREQRVAEWGRNSVSPFTLGPGRCVVDLPNDGVAGVVVKGRTAVMATDPVARPGHEEQSLTALLDILKGRGLRPVFAAVTDPAPYLQRGFFSRPVAEDAMIDLTNFSLSGKRRSGIRHSVTSAGKAGLQVVPWSEELADGARLVSTAWLDTKRGGEMGFTLGRFDPERLSTLDCRLALDETGRVIGLGTWHPFDDGRGRVLDLMRRLPDAPNPTIDLLIAESLLDFARGGVALASLGSVPLSHGTVAERWYPTRSLWRYKAKFDPSWEMRHIVVSARPQMASALRAVVCAYCPEGVMAATRRNA